MFVPILHLIVFFWKFGSKNWSSPNGLKFGTEVHCYILFSNVMFIFSKFLPFIFCFGEICYQNLKFSKLTKIWYRGALVYAYYDFNVYFSKIFAVHVFFGQIWSNNLNFFKFGRGVHCYMLITILKCFFFENFVIHIILDKFGLKI